MFEAACNGDYLESSSGRIEVEAPTASVYTINRMLDYLYLNDYEVVVSDNLGHLPGTSSAAINGLSTSSTALESNRAGSSVEHISIASLTGQRDAENAKQTEITGAQEEHTHSLTPWAQRMICHIHVYGIADYYQIADLKHTALKKIEGTMQEDDLEDDDLEGYAQVVAEVKTPLHVITRTDATNY